MELPVVRLRHGREQSVLRKHPWVFSGAIQSVTKHLEDGSIVLVQDAQGHDLGVGHFQESSLSIRLFAFERVVVDEQFWLQRLTNAAAYRMALGFLRAGETDAFRLVHGEGDQLPGLIVDIYRDTAVVQAHSIGMHKALPQLTLALKAIPTLGIERVYDKSHDSLPASYAVRQDDGWIDGEGDGNVKILENRIAFDVDIAGGQKTGFFLDQRENRSMVGRYADEKTLLNCFAYTGGFSLYALAGGASRVSSVEASGAALAILDRNVELNGFGGRHHSIKDDVLKYLTREEELYDVIVVDPPAFAKSLAKRHNAVQAYKRLNALAMKRIRPGGMLFTFSCSQVVDRALFHNTIVAAAIESGRMARVMHDLGQGPDHPVSIYHPEGQYLKGLALYIE